jgi:hypothetical protein
MQAELLLISRNVSAILEFLPQALRTSNLIEARRDAATGMKAFLSGPSSNLLAPSFGGWTLDNGRHAWSYMTGISITYSGALKKLIELTKMVPGFETETALYTARLGYNVEGLAFYLAPTNDYFVRSVDPNGTLHGVLGQTKHGYFEASPNHDAVALRVVDDVLAAKIVNKIKSLGAVIRPNIFILPNSDATGKPSVAGAGGVGYDDMACGDGNQCGGIFEFGTWVNGGVWTTTEGRWLLACARMGDIDTARESVRQMMKLFGTTWRMDNPIVNFGLAPYQPDEDINLTIDNFASAGGLLRGLFEYLYSSTNMTLIPHIPDNATSYTQNFGVRWGPYRIFLSTAGVRSSGIASFTINGATSAGHTLTTTSLMLDFASLPVASAASVSAVNSSISTASTRLDLVISFKTAGAGVGAGVAGATGTFGNEKGAEGMQRSSAPNQPVQADSQHTNPPHSQLAAQMDPPLPAGLVQHFTAAAFASTTKDGAPIASWPSALGIQGNAASFPCLAVGKGGAPPTYSAGTNVGAGGAGGTSGVSGAGVLFDGKSSVLCSNSTAAALPAKQTFIAAFSTRAAAQIFCVVVAGLQGGYDGIAVSPIAAGGVQLDIDWIGSTDQERDVMTNIVNTPVVASTVCVLDTLDSFTNPYVVFNSMPLGYSTACHSGVLFSHKSFLRWRLTVTSKS